MSEYTDDWRYKPDYDEEIYNLVKNRGWGSYRIFNELKRKYFELDISIATVARRVRDFKKQLQATNS